LSELARTLISTSFGPAGGLRLIAARSRQCCQTGLCDRLSSLPRQSAPPKGLDLYQVRIKEPAASSSSALRACRETVGSNPPLSSGESATNRGRTRQCAAKLRLTFFVPGGVIEKYPAQIDLLAKYGHERGCCHGVLPDWFAPRMGRRINILSPSVRRDRVAQSGTEPSAEEGIALTKIGPARVRMGAPARWPGRGRQCSWSIACRGTAVSARASLPLHRANERHPSRLGQRSPGRIVSVAACRKIAPVSLDPEYALNRSREHDHQCQSRQLPARTSKQAMNSPEILAHESGICSIVMWSPC